eukprot:scaffold8789_cov186-Skeletonema_marinoi.AAC.6
MALMFGDLVFGVCFRYDYPSIKYARVRNATSASGLVVKSNVAIVGPRVRFSAGAAFTFAPVTIRFSFA